MHTKTGPVKITVLGCGTSTGVPVPSCSCSICCSTDPRNNRLRTSIYLENNDAAGAQQTGILFDTSTDLRQQSLRAGIRNIDAVFFTHAHADHIFGLDDLRGFNFSSGRTIPLYAGPECAGELERIFRYTFDPDKSYSGGPLPQLMLNRITPCSPVRIGGVEILPLPVEHGNTETFGYRIGDFAYLTDCSGIPVDTRRHLQGLDLLILDALRYRAHTNHFDFESAVAEVERLRPNRTYFVHMSHEVDYTEGNTRLRLLTKLDVQLAYDGLVLEA